MSYKCCDLRVTGQSGPIRESDPAPELKRMSDVKSQNVSWITRIPIPTNTGPKPIGRDRAVLRIIGHNHRIRPDFVAQGRKRHRLRVTVHETDDGLSQVPRLGPGLRNRAGFGGCALDSPPKRDR